MRIWSAKTGKELVQLHGHEYVVRCLAFSSDGAMLFSASGDCTRGGSVRAWSLVTGKELRQFSLCRSRAASQPEPLCFSPGGKTFVCAIHQYLPPKKGAKTLIDAYAVTFLDVDTGEIVRKLEPREGRFKSAAFSPDGKLLATMNGVATLAGNMRSEVNNRLQVWDTTTGKQLVDCAAYAEHLPQWPTCVAFSPDGKKVAVAATSPALHVWDVGRGREDPERPATHHDEIACVAFSSDGRTLASGSGDHAIVLWDAVTGEQRLRLHGDEGVIWSLAFSPDGKRLASASRFHDQTIRLWDLTTAKEIRHFFAPLEMGDQGLSKSVTSWITFAAGGQLLAIGGTDQKVRLWDAASGKMLLDQLVRGLPPPVTIRPTAPPDWAREIQHITFTPDGRLMALSTAKTIFIVDVASAQRLFSFECGSGTTTAVLALSPDGRTLACGGYGNTFRLVEVASGKELHKVDFSAGEEVLALTFAPDGRSVAVNAGRERGTIYLFEVRSGQRLLRLRGQEGYVRSMAFSPDGTKLASGQFDSTVLVWDVSAARRKLVARSLTRRELDHLWADLRDTNVTKAHAALWSLVAAPQASVPLLKEHLHPVPRVPPERLRGLVADLDAEDFARREDASRKLAKIGIEAEPALREVIRNKPSLEMRRRVEALLSNLVCQTEMTPDALRQSRAIQVLEQFGVPAVHPILKELAGGAPAAPATRDAAAALARLRATR